MNMRNGLILVVLVALLPVTIVSFIQGNATLKHTRNLAFDRLRDTASAVAERQRDPFVIAQHLLLAHTTNRDVVRMTADCDTALRISLSNYPPVTNIARTAADGTVRCSAIPLSKPVNVAQEGWWRRGVNAKGMTITKAPVFAPISQRDVLFLILPLRTADGQSDGTITAAIDVKYLRDGLRQLI